MPIKIGDVVRIEYEIRDKDGKLLGTSKDNQDGTIKIHLGTGQVLPAFEGEIVGMSKGEKKKFSLEPDKAYGEFNPLLLEKIPKKDLSDDLDLQLRNMVEIVGPNGMTSTGWIRLIEDDFIIVDLNPPLAGKTLHFSVKLIESGLEPDENPNPFQFGVSCETCNHEYE
ncbi:MAG: hypothetical protein EU541_01890 [Promethearchaeota archaeon]|nr:MAG: hypothetical protein EU541_01890 [Candidatus Lokiarchaeota archaeon]